MIQKHIQMNSISRAQTLYIVITELEPCILALILGKSGSFTLLCDQYFHALVMQSISTEISTLQSKARR